jgi:hypothetical protein
MSYTYPLVIGLGVETEVIDLVGVDGSDSKLLDILHVKKHEKLQI